MKDQLLKILEDVNQNITSPENAMHNILELAKEEDNTNKRLFQKFDDINVKDIENGSKLLLVSSNFMEAETIPQGGYVKMGIDRESTIALCAKKYYPVLLLVDVDEYQNTLTKKGKQ